MKPMMTFVIRRGMRIVAADDGRYASLALALAGYCEGDMISVAPLGALSSDADRFALFLDRSGARLPEPLSRYRDFRDLLAQWRAAEGR